MRIDHEDDDDSETGDDGDGDDEVYHHSYRQGVAPSFFRLLEDIVKPRRS